MDVINTLPPPIERPRLREFDALRGVSMILVVFAHVLGGLDSSDCITGSIFATFRMPLFFFVSGFFAYRAYHIWDKKFYKRVFAQKIKAQIICSIVFYALLRYTWGVNPFGWIEKGFQGYWFTIVLFQMFTLYAVCNVIAHIIHKHIAPIMMIIISLGGMAAIPLGLTKNGYIFELLSTTNLCYFIQWFSLGLIVRQYEERFTNLISNSYVKAILIIGFVGGLCILHSDLQIRELVKTGIGVCTSYLGLLMVIALFYSAKEFFNSDNRISNCLCFTGRRTLDIYMIHYFFLPSMPMVGAWLVPNNMVIFQLIIGLTLAGIITAVCLLISSCLRTSPFLANWLFGVRVRRA